MLSRTLGASIVASLSASTAVSRVSNSFVPPLVVQDLRDAGRRKHVVPATEHGLLASVGVVLGRGRQIAEVVGQAFDILEVETEVVEVDLRGQVAAVASGERRLLDGRRLRPERRLEGPRLRGCRAGARALDRRRLDRRRVGRWQVARIFERHLGPIIALTRPLDRRGLLRHGETVGEVGRRCLTIVVFRIEILERRFETRGRALADLEHVVEISALRLSRSLRRNGLRCGPRRRFRCRCSAGRLEIEARESRLTEIEIDGFFRRLVEREVERRVARLEVDVDLARSRGRLGEQPFVWANLLAHDHDLVPVGIGLLAELLAEVLGRAQERVLVPPNEEHFEELQLEVTAIRRARRAPSARARPLGRRARTPCGSRLRRPGPPGRD